MFVKRKRVLASYTLLIFIACTATFAAVNYLSFHKLPIDRNINMTGFSDETKLALQISESEARALRVALHEQSNILAALPIALALSSDLMIPRNMR